MANAKQHAYCKVRRAIRLVGALALAAVFVLTTGGHLAAQSNGAPVVTRPAPQPQDQGNIRVRVNLVNTPAVVSNAKGQLITDLTEQDFRIFDNGVAQKTVGFDVGGTPVSVAIVIDTSARVQALLPELQKLGPQFSQTVQGEDGHAAVIAYDNSVDPVQPFTADHDAIDSAFSHLKVGTEGAKLYDAMARAVQMLREQPDSRRRVLVTIAEAIDTGSEDKLGRILRDAQESNITIYAIGLSSAKALLKGDPRPNEQRPITPPGTFAAPGFPGEVQTPTSDARAHVGDVNLTELAAWVVQHATDVVRERPLEIATTATGGLYQSTIREKSIAPTIDEISAELHAQYTLSYRPTNTGAGDYHNIRVEVVSRKGMKVRTRPGYYLGAGATPQG